MTNREYLRKLNSILLERFEIYLQVENDLANQPSSFFTSKDLLDLKESSYANWQTLHKQYEHFKTYLYNCNIPLDNKCDNSLPDLDKWN